MNWLFKLFPAFFVLCLILSILWYALVATAVVKYGVPAADAALEILQNTAESTKPQDK